MNAKTWLVIGACLGALGVAAGAFGAHYLPKYLEISGAASLEAERMEWWETAARYQLYHALALLAVAWVCERRKSSLAHFAGLAMFAGTIVFSGCLYGLALTGVRKIGAVVPIGGVSLIVGWILLAFAAGNSGSEKSNREYTPPDDSPNDAKADAPTEESP